MKKILFAFAASAATAAAFAAPVTGPPLGVSQLSSSIDTYAQTYRDATGAGGGQVLTANICLDPVHCGIPAK